MRDGDVMGIEQMGQPDDSMDIASMLDGTSGSTDTTGGSGAQSQDQGQLGQEMSDVFKFGGRAYKTQQEAEKAHNQLYGKFSESQSVLKQLKAALKDPAKLAQFQRDPAMAPILAKLGIQQAEEELEAEEAGAQDGQEMTPESFMQQLSIDRAGLSLEREEWAFERKLGRPITDDEHDAVMRIIGRAGTLTYAEAWKLAFHDKMLRAAQERQKQEREKLTRPKPGPGAHFIPGIKMDLKKPLNQMSPAEAREHLRNSQEFKDLMS